MLPEKVLQHARTFFPHTKQGKIYLNHAGTSPLSTRVVGAMTAYLQERHDGRLETYQTDMVMVAGLKALIQELINAESPERIALTSNTSDAINIVASGIPWKSGDRILLNTAEFPANVWPFLNLQRHGVRLDFSPSDDGIVTPEMILDSLKPGTRMVGLSAVQFLSGYRADLAAIGEHCHRKGIIFAVDGIQSIGAIRLDVQRMKIDALSAGGQKWQMSPHGTGFLYLTDELQSIIQQSYLGWLAVEDPWDFHNFSQRLAAGARRFEGGSLAMPALWGMHGALELIREFGIDAIEEHLLGLTEILLKGFSEIPGVGILTPRDNRSRAGIATIKVPDNADQNAVFKKLLGRDITAALRDNHLRFSPHFYCSPDEMLETVAAVKKYTAVKQ